MDILQEHIKLLSAHFAILQRTYGSRLIYAGKRRCTRGYNCGGSCITRSKNCRKALEGEAKNFSEWLVEKMIGNMGTVLGDKPVDPPKPPRAKRTKKKKPEIAIDQGDYKSVIEGGKEFATRLGLDKPDYVDNLFEEEKILIRRNMDLEHELMFLRQDEVALRKSETLSNQSLLQDNLEQQRKIEEERSANKKRRGEISEQLSAEKEKEIALYKKAKAEIIKHHRDKGYTEQAAKDSANRLLGAELKQEGKVFSVPSKSEVKNFKVWAKEMYMLSGGKGSESLRFLVKTDQRQWARDGGKGGGVINVGKNNNKSVTMHEIGHHIEFENPQLKKAANEWMRSRATSLETQKLKDMVKGSSYKDPEVAYPGNYIDPYVGKVYDDGSTEVISMALQHFSDPESMRRLKRKDPEYFYFALGILLS